jgi:hypothetical protein
MPLLPALWTDPCCYGLVHAVSCFLDVFFADMSNKPERIITIYMTLLHRLLFMVILTELITLFPAIATVVTWQRF